MHERGRKKVTPHFIAGSIANLVSGNVSIKYGFKGPNHCVVTACATGTHSIGDASRMIMLDDADVMVAGGSERQHSVLNALKACNPETDLVFIHDGVRPFVKQSDLDNLISKMENCDAAILAGKEKNTLKLVKQNIIEKTVPRVNIYKAFTPQVFRFKQIIELHAKAKDVEYNFTDDASILEYFGKLVEIVECGDYNLKLTEPADLQYAEYIIKNDLFKE